MRSPSLEELEERRLLVQLDDLDRLSFALVRDGLENAETQSWSEDQIRDCKYMVRDLAKLLLSVELWNVDHHEESHNAVFMDLLHTRCAIRFKTLHRWVGKMGRGGWDNNAVEPMPDQPIQPYAQRLPVPVTSA
jgi:hypothetical protein